MLTLQARKAKAPPGPEEVVKSVIAGREAGKEEEVLSNMVGACFGPSLS